MVDSEMLGFYWMLDAGSWIVGSGSRLNSTFGVRRLVFLPGCILMLRPKRFRPFEKFLLFAIASLLAGASAVGAFFAFRHANWRVGLASAGVLLLAVTYCWAARRGRPL